MWTNYLFPGTVEEALRMLQDSAGQARIIAGGTDLVLQAQRGQCPSTIMVDITRIPGLDGIEQRDGWVRMGALTTHAQIARSPLIQQTAGLLSAACNEVGGPQIRNVATLVGNVVNAMPAADGAVALFALDAEIEVATPADRQWKPIADLYAGVGICTVDPCFQMVTGIRFRPLPKTAGWAYLRISQRRALNLPMVTTAVVARLEGAHVAEACIAVGPVAPTPFRASAAEQALRGAPANAESIAAAAQLAREEANPRDSTLRGSREYRKHLVEVLVRRALQQAASMIQPS